MKKIILPFLFLLALPCEVWAQSSMSDAQIMEFIIKENEKGTSREQIMTKLVERGVTVDRVRKLRSKYEKQQRGDIVGAKNVTGLDPKMQNRLRQNNGQARDEQPSASDVTSRRRRKSYSDPGELTEREQQLLRERQIDELDGELDFLLPDSLDLYDRALGLRKPKEREVYGRNIFNNKHLTFESDLNIATPADYRLGAGDVVYVDVWGASQKSYQATVTPDGDIELEGYGLVNVGGLTVSQANSRLRSTLGSRFASSQVKLTVGQTKTITVNVMGEVKNPGTFTLSAFSTVFHALYMAGGTNDIGTLRQIRVYRNNRLLSTVDIYDYIQNGQMTGNVRLASGDVIQVGAYEALVNITGKVKRPMFYEMKPNESLGTLIKYAGGFRGDAYQDQVRVVRKAGGQMSVFSVGEFEQNSFQLCDEDSVSVDSVLDRYSNMAELRGAVFRPGMYQVDGELTTVRQLVEAAGGLREDAVANHAVLHRRKADRTLEVVSVDIRGVLNHTVPDVTLRNEDVLFVPSSKEIQEERSISIHGEVNYPGIYEYADNMTLEDFVLLAGGLTDAASVVKVDVSRRVRDNKSVQAIDNIAQTYSFSLKDGFVIDGQQAFRLEPFDEVFVRRSPGYLEQQHVTVEGEVVFAGDYTLDRKGARLSDLVGNAGGLTQFAYAKGARLERKITPEERIKQQTMLRIITANAEDSTSLQKLQIGDTRPIGIDLDRALANPGSQWDIVLREGDRLVIPQYNNTVSINGEVMYPNTVSYVPTQGLNYYINQAGGFGLHAKPRRVFAVNMNGTVTRVRTKDDISPGCEIIVPAKSKKNRLSTGDILGFSTLGISLASVMAAILK